MLNALDNYKRRKKMTTKELEKQILKAIKEDARLPFATDVGHKMVIQFVKKLFKEYNNE